MDTTECEFEYTDSSGKSHRGITSPDKDLEDCLNLNYEMEFTGRKKGGVKKISGKVKTL